MRQGLTAAATLSVARGPGRQVIHWAHAWPVVLRPTGDDRVHLVHGAGGPLGGDVLSLALDVGAAATLAVRSAGATLVQPGVEGGAARWDTGATVAPGGHLDWAPQATIVTDDAVFDNRLTVALAPGATATVREIVVLGRHGTRGGRYRGEVTVTLDGEPLLAHSTLLDGSDPVLNGPGGTAGARAVGSLLLVGATGAESGCGERPGVRWAWTALDGPGRLLLAVGDPGPVTAVLDSPTTSR